MLSITPRPRGVAIAASQPSPHDLSPRGNQVGVFEDVEAELLGEVEEVGDGRTGWWRMGFQPVAGLPHGTLRNLSELGVWTSAEPDMAVSELWKGRKWCNKPCRQVGLSLVKVAHQGELESSRADPRRQVLCCPVPLVKH